MNQEKKTPTRYMVPVDTATVEIAKKISDFARGNGLPVSYTAILRQALKEGLAARAKKFDIDASALLTDIV